jgi:glycosyltransferase involved in cell wall biosynthesis
MHILYFHQHFSTPEGGAGIRSYEMAKKLIAKGHKVTMVCGSYSGGKTGLSGEFKSGKRYGVVDGIKVIEFELEYSNELSFFKRTMTFVTFALRSVKLALTEKYDLLFATSTPLTAGIPGIVARWLKGKKFIFEVRDLWPEIPREMGVIKNPVILKLMGLLEWVSYKSATALIGLSPGIKKGIERHNISDKRVTMIPNGCDLEIFNQSVAAWQPHGVNDDDLMAVFTGTHGFANGLDAVINAAIKLKKSGRSDIKLVLIGRGIEKPRLIERTNKEGLDNVIFLVPVNKEELAKLLKRSDVGLQILANVPAFYYGTSPNKFFDYIAAGKPVLNNYPGWLASMINESNCGQAIPPEDSDKFAEALIWFADNRTKLSEMGQRARELAEFKFDRNKLSDQFVNWLEYWESK